MASSYVSVLFQSSVIHDLGVGGGGMAFGCSVRILNGEGNSRQKRIDDG